MHLSNFISRADEQNIKISLPCCTYLKASNTAWFGKSNRPTSANKHVHRLRHWEVRSTILTVRKCFNLFYLNDTLSLLMMLQWSWFIRFKLEPACGDDFCAKLLFFNLNTLVKVNATTYSWSFAITSEGINRWLAVAGSNYSQLVPALGAESWSLVGAINPFRLEALTKLYRVTETDDMGIRKFVHLNSFQRITIVIPY